MNDIELLKNICFAHGVVSNEDEMANVIKTCLDEREISYTTDVVGNIIVGNSVDPKILIAAHMDEVGLMVSKINSNGTISFHTLGYIHPHTLLNSNIELFTKDKKLIKGYIASDKMFNGGLSNYELKHNDLFIDIGCISIDEVKKQNIDIGTIGTYEKTFTETDTSIMTTSLDNGIGVYLLFELLKVNENLRECVFVFHRGEELGSIGANYLVNSLKAPFTIVVDYIPAVANQQGHDIFPLIGEGPCVLYKASNHILNSKYVEILNSMESKHKFQKAFMSKDSEVPHFEQFGSLGANICVPARGFHGTNYVVTKSDINETKEFILELIKKLIFVSNKFAFKYR